MNPQLYFWITFLVLSISIIFFGRKYSMLRDASSALRKPYSFSRVQLGWWTLILISSFTSILIVRCDVATFDTSQLILLGISAATMASAKLIDISDQNNVRVNRSQDLGSDNFFLDILSDENGVSVHRFQSVIFNLIFGIWFILKINRNLDAGVDINLIMPVLSNNNLILLGLSSGTYAALKATENKDPLSKQPSPL